MAAKSLESSWLGIMHLKLNIYVFEVSDSLISVVWIN